MALLYTEEDLIEWFTRTDLSNFMIDASNATPAQPKVFATSTVSLKDGMSIAGARKVSQVG
ncbi:unnamed protein product [Penicillium camemberti]|uniref:Str. FM013 n=1 Tax=Penicillium camemberti (strain FM 013) TaxID=1429867 RepID=A0A0G4PSB0_PENC3|nr:unnamed protein product [Penicillium camemberti]